MNRHIFLIVVCFFGNLINYTYEGTSGIRVKSTKHPNKNQLYDEYSNLGNLESVIEDYDSENLNPYNSIYNEQNGPTLSENTTDGLRFLHTLENTSPFEQKQHRISIDPINKNWRTYSTVSKGTDQDNLPQSVVAEIDGDIILGGFNLP